MEDTGNVISQLISGVCDVFNHQFDVSTYWDASRPEDEDGKTGAHIVNISCITPESEVFAGYVVLTESLLKNVNKTGGNLFNTVGRQFGRTMAELSPA